MVFSKIEESFKWQWLFDHNLSLIQILFLSTHFEYIHFDLISSKEVWERLKYRNIGLIKSIFSFSVSSNMLISI